MYINLFNPLIPEFKGYDEEWFLQIHLCNTAILFMAIVLASSCSKGTLKGQRSGGGGDMVPTRCAIRDSTYLFMTNFKTIFFVIVENQGK